MESKANSFKAVTWVWKAGSVGKCVLCNYTDSGSDPKHQMLGGQGSLLIPTCPKWRQGILEATWIAILAKLAFWFQKWCPPHPWTHVHMSAHTCAHSYLKYSHTHKHHTHIQFLDIKDSSMRGSNLFHDTRNKKNNKYVHKTEIQKYMNQLT